MKKGTVLVVDDAIRIRNIVQSYLHENDYEVITADCGKAALQLIEKQNPDIVILDIVLPDMSGLEVCRRIRMNHEIPIIYLSGLKESETIVSGLDLGGDDFLTKPFDPNVLVAHVNAIMRRTKYKNIQAGKTLEDLLTHQEIKILQWIEKGYTNKEIADKLALSENTIKVYNSVIFQKLDVRNRTQAIVRAKEGMLI